MAKLSKREREKIESQMSVVRRDVTWVGLRPAIMKDKTKYGKHSRRESRELCRCYC